MTLESQVTNLELSKKLKELGVKQNSFFYWITWDDGDTKLHNYSGEGQDLVGDYCSAFTCSELGEILPRSLWIKRESYYLNICHNAAGGWLVSYGEYKYLSIGAETMADAMAKMLIYLIENKLLPVHK